MTTSRLFVPFKEKKSSISYGQVCFGAFSLFCLLLILKNPDIAIDCMKNGLQLCAQTVIPSLFPFMVLSEIIVSGKLGDELLAKITLPLQKLFRLPAAGCCAVLLGMLCGFPIGAKCATSAYESGQLTREETEHVLLFSNNPSSAFLINAVGASLFGNKAFGILLYGITLTVSLMTGILFALLRKKKEKSPKTEIPLSSKPPLKGAKLFTESVASATRSILLVCAYVVFFSALAGTLNLVLKRFHVPLILQTMVSVFLELSGGAGQAVALPNIRLAAVMCAFAAGWSGLSVHCQVLSVCEGKGLTFSRYFISKFLQGLLCALLCGIALHIGMINFA